MDKIYQPPKIERIDFIRAYIRYGIGEHKLKENIEKELNKMATELSKKGG